MVQMVKLDYFFGVLCSMSEIHFYQIKFISPDVNFKSKNRFHRMRHVKVIIHVDILFDHIIALKQV